ncbi:assembly protein for periplasmic nitrate reductase [Pseudovibrio axinellae]|uniref:Chaperone NapD n=1 Tax=Pseudovibrio axinellae TaxID=989403 RepID=A0A165T165_9HYPH|nr:chaperone NapD [Pseudovibrio axinellae]KZL05155.1 assembly protein for periplasmic nitrate reductase [Pseudovibrio axinellae]SER50332.1 periplasmic nitrate reductase chaperone NapD [Pseudovibrio axinellae]
MRNATTVERVEEAGVWHISSVLIMAEPAKREQVCAAIEQIEAAEIAEATGTEKIIVTLETTSERDIANALAEIQQLEGVVTASLIFHQTDTTDLNSIVISDQGDIQPEGTCS